LRRVFGKPRDLRRLDYPTILLLGLSAGLLAYLSIVVLLYYAGALVAPGPNTIGEAGKVFFAQRFADGESIFESGLEPPYYPSVHGALLHALPGAVGSVLGVDTTTYYYIGRAISVALTLATWFLAIRILTLLEISRWWIVAVLLLILAERHVFNHTVSYRPDNWLLFLSVACCLLVLSGRSGWRISILLSVLPVLAFYTKATALTLLGSIVVALIATRRAREALQIAGAAILLLLFSGAALQYVSDGRFLEAFSSGTGVGFSLKRSARFMIDPLLLFVVSSPILLSAAWRKDSGPATTHIRTLMVFWAVGLFFSMAAASRTGSNYYYFVEPYFYGSLLLVCWLQLRIRQASSSTARRTAAAVIFVVSFVSFASHLGLSGKLDIALYETLLYADERPHAAYTANTSGRAVFSSDPGLNVLLDNPGTVHPSLQTDMVSGGVLPIETLTGPVERCEYERIYLTRHGFEFHGVQGLPPEFFQAVEERYELVPYDEDYLVYEPRRSLCRTRP
jgi:hypothetical protein